ncbi:hypothetical protein [Schlesneria sp. T3-172]|uniref:hypothetical protein n=1 Tax=Schlesneria sphaerica TaxID=3373610 RepID=UPI0037C63B4A
MKKLNLKALLVNHAEKIVFGLFVLIVLGVLAGGTSWARYSKITPDTMQQNIKNARAKIAANNVWPQEKQAAFAIVDFSEKARMLFTSPSIARYDFSQWLFHPLYRKDEPKREPIYEAVQNLIVKSAFVPLSILSEEARQRAEMALSEQAEEETTEDDENSEFGRRSSSGGTGQSPFGRPGPGGPMAGPAGMGRGAMPGAHAAPGGRGRPGAGLNMMPPGARGDDEDMRSAGMMGPGGMMSGMGMGMGSDNDVRGVRLMAVRGVFPVRKQIENYKNALHITEAEAADLLEITDFELQRQTAHAGPNPWENAKWETVDIQHALQVLTDSSDIDAEDPVPTALRDSVITMDLPLNLLGVWREYATHPRIRDEELSPEAIAEEMRLLETINEVAVGANLGDEAQPRRRGLAPAQRDFRNLASRVSSDNNGRNMMEEMMKSMRSTGGGMQGMPPMPGGAGMGAAMRGMPAGAAMGAAGGRGMQGMPMGGSSMGMPGMRGTMGMPGMGGGMRGSSNNPLDFLTARRKYLLFRYFDFDVESGKAYRYRVQLKLRNPNFELTAEELAGADMEIAKGEERETPWSNISNPDYVRPTAAYYLQDIERDPYADEKVRSSTRPVALISMYDWDTKKGAVLSDVLNLPAIGSYIGETKKATPIPDLIAGTLEKGEHAFSTQDMLVDVESDIEIAPDQHPDLKLTPDKKRPTVRLGLLEEALVATSFGELRSLGSPMNEIDRESLNFWKKRESEERAVIKSRESLSPQNNMGPAGMMGPGGMGPMGMMGMAGNGEDGEGGGAKKKNPRKAGQRGGMGMMMMMPGGASGMPGGMMPGMQQQQGGRGSKSKSR